MSVGIKTTWGMYLKCRFLGSSPGPTEPDFPGLTLESFFFFKDPEDADIFDHWSTH